MPTSQASAALAERLHIPLVSLDEVETIDLTVDGADEVDPQLNMIKGLGGALLREKVVAAASRKLVILVGEEKLVDLLGRRGVLPVEVVPFAISFCRRRLESYRHACDSPRARRQALRHRQRQLHPRLADLATRSPACDRAVPAHIPGVVGTGLFLDMADVVLVQTGDRVEETPERNEPLMRR